MHTAHHLDPEPSAGEAGASPQFADALLSDVELWHGTPQPGGPVPLRRASDWPALQLISQGGDLPTIDIDPVPDVHPALIGLVLSVCAVLMCALLAHTLAAWGPDALQVALELALLGGSEQ